jgi:adenylylsulfate kinase
MPSSSPSVRLLIRGVAHRGDEARARRALDSADRVTLVIPGGPDAALRLAAATALVDHYLPRARCEIVSDSADGELETLVRCARCGIVSVATCPHGAEPVDAATDRALAAPGALPADLFRPEIAAVVGRVLAAETVRRPGAILWFTGMSGAGKSTLSQALAQHLTGVVPVEVLDGDEVREHLSKGLSFSREDRDINVHRIAFVARTLARHGVTVITAAISPYAETRREARRLAEAAGVVFVEIYARAELAALVARDVKGLYKKALANEIPHFTGVSDPYEPPTDPDVEAYTDRESVEDSTARILATLRQRGVLS